jgi:hypothetical protein
MGLISGTEWLIKPIVPLASYVLCHLAVDALTSVEAKTKAGNQYFFLLQYLIAEN